jgi:hypothetical protein
MSEHDLIVNFLWWGTVYFKFSILAAIAGLGIGAISALASLRTE